MLTRRGKYLRSVPDDDAPETSRHLERHGWVLLRGVFDAEAVDELAQDISRVYDDYAADVRRPGRSSDEREQYRYEMLNRSAVCQKAVAHPDILAVVEPLLAEDCHIIANTAWRNPPNVEHTHGGGFWHIDAGPHVPLPEGVRWDERIPHPVFAIAAHILLQDCPAASGPTGVIPHSHLSGLAPPKDRVADPELSWDGNEPLLLEAQAGDVQLFVSDVWHRRMPTSDGDSGRFFLQVHYARRDLAQRLRTTTETNHLADDTASRASTARERSLIGIHEPFFYDG